MRRWTNQRVAHDFDSHRSRSVWTVIGAMALVAIPLGTYAYVKNECLRLSLKIEELQRHHDALLEERRRLTSLSASLRSLDRVERWARRNGLQDPTSDRVIVVSNQDLGRH